MNKLCFLARKVVFINQNDLACICTDSSSFALISCPDYVKRLLGYLVRPK